MAIRSGSDRKLEAASDVPASQEKKTKLVHRIRKTIKPPQQPMLLREVRLERFKASFKPAPVTLGSFNVIIGRNGSGKSTLLEALQWLDTTMRRDAREASDRYFGTSDLVNLRSRAPYFTIAFQWGTLLSITSRWHYYVRVDDRGGVPFISHEWLGRYNDLGQFDCPFIETERERRIIPDGNSNSASTFPIREPDRLGLARVGEATLVLGDEGPAFISDFWQRAVFLRLSPNRLAYGSPALRKSFEPLLDEEGQTGNSAEGGGRESLEMNLAPVDRVT